MDLRAQSPRFSLRARTSVQTGEICRSAAGQVGERAAPFRCPTLLCRVLLPCSASSTGRCKETTHRGARASALPVHWDRNCQPALLGSSRFRRWPPRFDSSLDGTSRKSTPTHSRPHQTDHIRWPERSPLERLPGTRLRRYWYLGSGPGRYSPCGCHATGHELVTPGVPLAIEPAA
jgi:hypothetical protein